MSRRRPIAGAVAVLGAANLLLAACGGTSTSSSTSISAPPASKAPGGMRFNTGKCVPIFIAGFVQSEADSPVASAAGQFINFGPPEFVGTAVDSPSTVSAQGSFVTASYGTSRREILDALATIINEREGIPIEQIQLDKLFSDDLGLDSLSMVELVIAVEDKWNLSIPDGDLASLRTVGDMVAYIAKATS